MKEIANYKVIRKIKRLTEDQIALIKTLRAENKTYKQIKEVVGCSVTTVFAICHGTAELAYDQKATPEYKEKFAIATQIRKEFNEGKSRLYLAEKYNFTRAWITQIITNKQYYDETYKAVAHDPCEYSTFSIEEIQSMRKRYDEGEDIWSITDDFRARIKCNATGTIRKICKREMFKTI
jgi:DNA invertase Pin-like site-specific DNA recombinase